MFNVFGVLSPSSLLKPQHFDEVIGQLTELEVKSAEMGMSITSLATRQAIEHFKKFKPKINYQIVMSRAGEIYRVFSAEIQQQQFVRLLPERRKYLPDVTDGFGESVRNSFPNAAFDIEEAGYCLAVQRDTASVLHTMRILEFGLQKLAARFDVDFDRKNWNTMIDQIEAKIREISTNHTKPPNWKDEEEQFARVGKEFRYVKDAWRNHAMHARSKYTPEEAMTIYGHARELMIEVAKCLP